jgi:glycerol-1-phosphate dehydrogenase [NAD(P)+]
MEGLCACGKEHKSDVRELIVGSGVIRRLPAELKKRGCKRAFLLADVNTYAAAGERAEDLLLESGMPYSKYVFPQEHLESDEWAVGSAVMHFDKSCDTVVAVGSGVVGDVAKILANTAGAAYIIVATAPSMDG